MNIHALVFKPRLTARFTRPAVAGRLRVEMLEDRLVPASFDPQQTFAVGAEPSEVAVGDFNSDGKLDIAVSNGSDNTVSVLLNTTPAGATTPTFSTQTFAVGANPRGIAVGDFNNDGKLDIAVADVGADSVSVLLNQTAAGATTASFAAAQTVTVGNGPQGIAVGDFNNDGKLDIAVAASTSGVVTVLVNNTTAGSATVNFAQLGITSGANVNSVAVGDFNGDGKLDIAVGFVGGTTAAVLLNTTTAGGTVTFANPQTLAAGNNPTAVAVADFNGDGVPDLAVANAVDGTVSVLLNQTATGAAAATFAAQQTFAVGTAPFGVAIGDFNSDGVPDIVTANRFDGTVSVLTNTTPAGATTASFAAQQVLTVGTTPIGVAAADLNGDGQPDIVTANFGDNTVSVLPNTTVVTTTTPTPALTNPVQLVTTTGHDLYRIDSTGIHFLFGGIVAGASIAYEPTGEVMLVTTTSHDLYRIDASGIHFMFGGIIAGASLAYENGTEVMLVTTTGHDLYRIDSGGIHFLYGGIVAGASLAYENGSEVMLVTTTGHDLYQVDANGITFLFGGIVAGASVAEGPAGQEELITTTGGDVYQVDAAGIHFLYGGIAADASLTYEP